MELSVTFRRLGQVYAATMQDSKHSEWINICRLFGYSAFSIGTRMAMMYDGKIVEAGTPDEFRRSTEPVVKQFLEPGSFGLEHKDIEL